ncbi:MAG: hypothetical protein PHD01_14775 [Geobacteraceae bacterium]|nr:hypothetical protein [Geobacteraceae bacterium]
MRKIFLVYCLLLLPAIPAAAANMNCVDFELLKTTPAIDPTKKQVIIQMQSHCPEGGYNVEAGLYTGLVGNPTPWNQHVTTNLSYFGPNQTAPAKVIFVYAPTGVVKFKVEVKHHGDIWGEKIFDVPRPWTPKGPAIKKYENPIIQKIPKL